MFAQSSGDDAWKADITCFGCGEKGHLKRECPKKNKDKDQIHANIVEEEDPDIGENIFAQQKLRGMMNTPPPKNVGRLIYEYVDRLRYIR